MLLDFSVEALINYELEPGKFLGQGLNLILWLNM